ncbi:UNVERIFIED_CONTAM: hypothetical protein HDU68_012277 [Siphonaria sp. JEL0065]|nr:hypothetical protein HDU68_012277 [Siphonaria sp. JEL0065]
MRSLIQTTHAQGQWSEGKMGSPVLCVDSDNRRVFVCGVTEGGQVELSDGVKTLPLFPEAFGARAVGLQFLSDRGVLVIAFDSGELATFDTSTECYEVVGGFDDGIAAMAWAADGELGAVVSGATVYVLTADFDVVGERLLSATATIEAFVSVGWGKKETQFHGSAGKEAALAKVADVRDALTNSDDLVPRISWRGDGKFFCVSFVDVDSKRRAAAVFTREAEPHAAFEPIPRLQKTIAWRPQGNLVAAVQTLPSSQLQIVFFETNGLRHGEFALRESDKDAVVDQLAWNADSSVLAVVLKRREQHVVQLWTMGNYYYYLKQEIVAKDIDAIIWDPEDALRLYVSSEKGTFLQTFTFVTAVQTSSSASHKTNQPVLVTDGKFLLVTPFRTSNMPPPMYETKLGPFDEAISSASVGEDDLVAVLLSNGSIVLAKDINSTKPILTPLGNQPPIGVSYRQIAFHNPSTLLVIASSVDSTSPDHVVYFGISEDGTTIRDTGKVIVPSSVGLFRLNGDLRSLVSIVEAADGAVYEIENVDGTWSAEFLTELPTPCPWIGSVEIGTDADSLQTVVIGLSDRNRLYINTRLISSEITSFFVHDDHIIVTTLSHTARFIPLGGVEIEDDLNIPATGTMVHDESLRRVERGSRIVAAVPGDMKLILQMPRGNLETIYPRALVLSIIRASLDKLDYSNAFILCRKHRINMNLLVDHNPELFMANVDLFVSAVKDPDYLNLFVTSLSEVDVTTTMYIPSPPPPKRAAPYFKPSQKVNTLCATLRSALAPFDATTTYVTTVLTTYAKQTPQDLEGAMGKVKSMKAISLEETENALKYLIFLANANQLYNVALGMYDFQLVVMVAQYSQKDPREYLPFLTALKLLPQHRQYFKIDDHLSRFSSALSHLVTLILLLESNPVTSEEAKKVFKEELIPYMVKNELFKDALAKYEGDEEKWKEVVNAYGGFLFTKARFAESGLMYQMAGEKAKALLSYRSDYSLWKQALSTAQEMKLSEKEVLEIANELGETLMERHEYASAATVYIEYCGDIVTGVRCLLKGCFWDEAVRIAYKNNRGDLVGGEIKTGVLAEYETVVDDLKELLVTFQKQRARLETVRREHLEKQAKIDSGEYDPLLDTIDMMSDTTSMASSRKTGFSSRTGKSSISSANSSKSRRRQDRKRAAGREGGFYEEEFLVNSLFKAVEKSNSLRAPVYRLVTALMSHSLIKESRILQTTYANLLPALKTGCEGVFEKENIVNKGMNGKTVEEEKIAFMVKMGSLPAYMLPSSMGGNASGVASYGHNGSNKEGNNQITLEAEVERKRDPKYPDAPPVFSADSYGLDVL